MGKKKTKSEMAHMEKKKKKTSLKNKENQGSLPGKILHVWFIGERSFSSCPQFLFCNFVDTNAAPLVFLLAVQHAPESMLVYIFSPRGDSNIRRKSIHGIHPCGNLMQTEIKKKEIHPDMRSKKKERKKKHSLEFNASYAQRLLLNRN